MTFSRFLFSTLLLPVLVTLSSFCPDETGRDEVCFNLENSVVAAYLQDAHAHYADGIGREGVSRLNARVLGNDQSPYLSQVVEQYDTPNWAELPAAVPIPSVGGVVVQISDRPDFAALLEFPSEGDTTFVSNLIPQKVYWYRVFDTSGGMLSDGIFKTLGQVRMIQSRNVFNVRDVGGWPCDGGRLSYGRLFRSAALDKVATSDDALYDIDVFTKKLGIGVEMDLRAPTISRSPLGPGVKFYQKELSHYLYMMNNTYWSPSSSQVRSGSYYANLQFCLQRITYNLMDDRRIVVHCSYGADRAGTLMFIIEALCGVSEADLVIDWELSSFTGKCYRKYIDQEELPYYYMDGDNLVKTYAEMRSLFRYLYENYGGREGASVQQQVVAWLQDKIFVNTADRGTSIIEALRRHLIVPQVKSPTIVRDVGLDTNHPRYATTFESTCTSFSEANRMISAVDATYSASNDFSSTGPIDCSGYSHLLVNVPLHDVAAFYDVGLHFIGGILDEMSDDEEAADDSKEEVTHEYAIPTDAAYVRFNIPTGKRWTAVLSAGSILNPDNPTEDIPSVVPDGIEPSSDMWYSLDGRCLHERPTSKGLYLHQGRKVLVR